MSPPAVEAPVAWRVYVQPANRRPFDKEFRPKLEYTVCATREEAEREKQRQRVRHGDDAAICISPLFPTKPKRARERKARQESLTAAGWPIQMRPPRGEAPA
jgi:hypothetical protein